MNSTGFRVYCVVSRVTSDIQAHSVTCDIVILRPNLPVYNDFKITLIADKYALNIATPPHGELTRKRSFTRFETPPNIPHAYASQTFVHDDPGSPFQKL